MFCGSINRGKDLHKRTENPIFEDQNDEFSQRKEGLEQEVVNCNHQDKGFEQQNEDLSMHA